MFRFAIFFIPLLFALACADTSDRAFSNNLIDSSRTKNIVYVYDEVYGLETRYYDYQNKLVKTVKYDDIVRCVIYNVESKEAMQLKQIELELSKIR